MGKELALKAHVQVKFCSDPVRSEDYFPEWKPALNAGLSQLISISLFPEGEGGWELAEQ